MSRVLFSAILVATQGGANAPAVTIQCTCFDHNHDSVLDQADVVSFVGCATGPGIVPGSVPPGCVP